MAASVFVSDERVLNVSVASGKEHEPAEQLDHEQIDEAEEHDRRG
jgi:hypothetical protein